MYLNPDSHKVERYSRRFDKPNHGTLLEGSRGKMLRVHEESKGTYFFRVIWCKIRCL